MTVVVNLYGGPGSGKSTIAAQLFANLKWEGVKCELVTEVAKELAYTGALKNVSQRFVTTKQMERQNAPNGAVDFIITDSPVDLGLIYMNKYDTLDPAEARGLDRDIRHFMYHNKNIDIFLFRTKKYDTYGRLQTEEEAKQIDKEIFAMLVNKQAPFSVVNGDKMAAYHIRKIMNEKKF